MVSVSGVRGVVGETLTPEVIVRYGLAFGQFVKRKKVVIGRDARPSGPMVQNLAAGALLSTGCDVVDIGLTTTPTLELAVTDLKASGGVMVTASHNPAEWNALKFFNASGTFLTPQQTKGVFDRAKKMHPGVKWNWAGKLSFDASRNAKHIEQILGLPLINAFAIQKRRFRVVVDCVNGSGGVVVPELLARLGCEVTPLFCEPTGLFPHNPEPVPKHLTALAQKVKETGADLGFAVDPDVDRLALVTEKGDAISEEYTLALAADLVLSKTPGRVVVNLSTSRMVEDVAKKHGMPCYRTPVGEANVVLGLKKNKGVVGGEGNGGVILPALHYGRDALVGMALILQLLVERQKTLNQLVSELPAYQMEKIKKPLPAGFEKRLKKLALAFDGTRPDWRDGLRLDLPEGWLQVRKSNTEPVCRIVAEGQSEKSVNRILKEAQKVLQS